MFLIIIYNTKVCEKKKKKEKYTIDIKGYVSYF